jgi:hypothetical protein
VPSKEHILAEIRRIAGENGRAPGFKAFTSATGISKHTWLGKHWRAWGDALTEAGFTPNALMEARSENELLLALIALTQKLKRLPADVDLLMERQTNAAFPSSQPFRKLGWLRLVVRADRRYVVEHPEHSDIIAYLPKPSAVEPTNEVDLDDADSSLIDGHVYMLKLGKHYKIGRSESVPTRHRQINLELPEKAVLVHKIATDDCVGVEKYWHDRFAARRTNGEWFALTRQDVAAFKRRKFM